MLHCRRATREVAADFVTGVRAMGLDWIQFLDENCGAASFPCYSSEHGHPPAPGNWMTAHMGASSKAWQSSATTAPKGGYILSSALRTTSS